MPAATYSEMPQMFVDIAPTFDPKEIHLRDTVCFALRALYAATAKARHTAVRHPSCAVSARLLVEAQEAVKVAQKEWTTAQDVLQDYTRHRDLKTFKVF